MKKIKKILLSVIKKFLPYVFLLSSVIKKFLPYVFLLSIIHMVFTAYFTIENLCIQKQSFCPIGWILFLWIFTVIIIRIIKIEDTGVIKMLEEIAKAAIMTSSIFYTVFLMNHVFCGWTPAYCPIGWIVSRVLMVIAIIIVVLYLLIKNSRQIKLDKLFKKFK